MMMRAVRDDRDLGKAAKCISIINMNPVIVGFVDGTIEDFFSEDSVLIRQNEEVIIYSKSIVFVSDMESFDSSLEEGDDILEKFQRERNTWETNLQKKDEFDCIGNVLSCSFCGKNIIKHYQEGDSDFFEDFCNPKCRVSYYQDQITLGDDR